MSLQCCSIESLNEPSLAWQTRKHHTAGVTAVIPLSQELCLTGSYDDHIRLISTPSQGRKQILTELDLGGGVWRLKLLDQAEQSQPLSAAQQEGSHVKLVQRYVKPKPSADWHTITDLLILRATCLDQAGSPSHTRLDMHVSCSHLALHARICSVTDCLAFNQQEWIVALTRTWLSRVKGLLGLAILLVLNADGNLDTQSLRAACVLVRALFSLLLKEQRKTREVMTARTSNGSSRFWPSSRSIRA